MEKEVNAQTAEQDERKLARAKLKKKITTRKKGAHTTSPSDDQSTPSDSQTTTAAEKRPKTLYRVKFFYEWCKSCGICSAMCPKKIILLDEQGHPYIEDKDGCIGCRNCEIHCPDFAITVEKRFPDRRQTNGA